MKKIRTHKTFMDSTTFVSFSANISMINEAITASLNHLD